MPIPMNKGDTIIRSRGDTYVTPVLLLCAECKQPIKATITTAQWIKCEWISADGTCLDCHKRAKEQRNHAATNNQSGG